MEEDAAAAVVELESSSSFVADLRNSYLVEAEVVEVEVLRAQNWAAILPKLQVLSADIKVRTNSWLCSDRSF